MECLGRGLVGVWFQSWGVVCSHTRFRGLSGGSMGFSGGYRARGRVYGWAQRESWYQVGADGVYVRWVVRYGGWYVGVSVFSRGVIAGFGDE